MNYFVIILMFIGLIGLIYYSPNGSLSPLVRRLFGWLSLGAAVLLALRARFDFAAFMALIGVWMLGWRKLVWGDFFWPISSFTTAFSSIFQPKTAPIAAVIKTKMLEITLSSQGVQEAKILAGRFSGKTLSALPPASLKILLDELFTADPSGMMLIAEYLDGRLPGWREDMKFNANAGMQSSFSSGEMHEEEAYQILGLQLGASEEVIRAAHRALIRLYHPDRGGSTLLAALINRAKDVALAARQNR